MWEKLKRIFHESISTNINMTQCRLLAQHFFPVSFLLFSSQYQAYCVNLLVIELIFQKNYIVLLQKMIYLQSELGSN